MKSGCLWIYILHLPEPLITLHFFLIAHLPVLKSSPHVPTQIITISQCFQIKSLHLLQLPPTSQHLLRSLMPHEVFLILLVPHSVAVTLCPSSQIEDHLCHLVYSSLRFSCYHKGAFAKPCQQAEMKGWTVHHIHSLSPSLRLVADSGRTVFWLP